MSKDWQLENIYCIRFSTIYSNGENVQIVQKMIFLKNSAYQIVYNNERPCIREYAAMIHWEDLMYL